MTERQRIHLSTRVGLKRNSGETCDQAKVTLEFTNQHIVSLSLVFGSEGVELRELGLGDEHHARGRVELHGAGSEGIMA